MFFVENGCSFSERVDKIPNLIVVIYGTIVLCLKYVERYSVSALTLQNSKTAEIQYYLKVYITKITQDDKSSSEKPLATNKATNTATGNDNPLASKTFYFECIENAFPQETEAYATDKNASFPASMATEVFLASVPNQLNFVFTTDRKALKQSAIAEFQISLSDEKAANNSSLPTRFEDEMQFEVDVKNVGSLTVVIHSGKLSKK